MTPSGLSIGTILKTKLFLNNLAPSSLHTKYSNVPYIMNETLLSPGCTLDIKMIALLFAISSGVESKLVIMTISQSFPAIVLQRTVDLNISLVEFAHNYFKKSQESL